MFEQVDRSSQEEFISIMRSLTCISNEDLQREHRFADVLAVEDEELSPLFANDSIISNVDTKLLCSLLPDIILVDPNNFNEREIQAVVVTTEIFDISMLWEKYRTQCKGGALRMTRTLNTYIGHLMHEAHISNGDVIYCNGNYIIAIWKQGTRSMSDCVHQAVDYALSFVKSYGYFETDIGMPINAKFAITCGTLTFSLIGTETNANYILFGAPLEIVREMLEKIDFNMLLINNEAWEQLNHSEYIAVSTDKSNEYYIVKDFSEAWRSIQEANDAPRKSFKSFDIELRPEIRKRKPVEAPIYEFRHYVRDVVNMQSGDDLKKFIFPPLLHVIEINDPIEILSEMRYMILMGAVFVIAPEFYRDSAAIINDIYNEIFRIVDKYKGHIFSVEYVEFELSFIVIFGFRGRRDESQSRLGLLAARKCFNSIDKSAYLTCSSISLVSGLVYCGVIGDGIRQTYTIIGKNLAKVKKLMGAFPRKVTCDRETFVQSKLEARHFVLQEVHNSAGVVDYGPVYEYVEIEIGSHVPIVAMNKFPLLDRQHEMDVVQDMFTSFQPKSNDPSVGRFNMMYQPAGLFIFGGPLMGKTRLIEEMHLMLRNAAPTFRINLSVVDKAVPYETIFLIFGLPMGFTDESTVVDRETKLTAKLRRSPLRGLAHLLNPVFRVNISRTSLVESLSLHERKTALDNLMRYLCFACFSRPWIIFIDGGEFIDMDSWELINQILKTHTVMVVCTIAETMQDLPEKVQHYLSGTKCKYLSLLPLSKQFHASLACQIMDCVGIPLELEKFLIDRSEGTPGWIQNFILSLIHSNDIWLRKVSNLDYYKYMLVLPQETHLNRTQAWTDEPHLISKTVKTLHNATILSQIKWEVFENLPKNSDPPIEEETITTESPAEETVEPKVIPERISKGRFSQIGRKLQQQNPAEVPVQKDDRTKVVNICIMAPQSRQLDSIYDAETNESFCISRIMDGLNANHIWVLKAASIIGDFFLRDMLMFIMEKGSERGLAETCRDLFEAGIFACAEGDFRKSIVYYAPIMTNHYKTFDNRDFCQDLPTYSSCGFMRFKDRKFRKAAYSLLAGEQISVMHKQALDFLLQRAHKCNSCGGEPFNNLLNCTYEEGVLARRRKKSYGSVDDSNSSTSSIIDENGIIRKMCSKSERQTRLVNRIVQSPTKSQIFFSFNKAVLGTVDDATERNFDRVDFTKCECKTILRCLYFSIRKHCILIGEYSKWMNATIEYSILCSEEHNDALALQLLAQALDVVNGEQYPKTFREGESWKYKAFKARILSEMGRVRMKLGQMRCAYVCYEHALQLYGYKVPKPCTLRFKLMKWKQYLMLSWRTRCNIGSKFGHIAQFYDSVSNCLTMMANLFMSLELWQHAYNTAMWSLKLALESEKSFITLLDAFATMITVSCRMQKYGILETLEVMALDYCRRYNSNIELNELRVVTNLYASVFYSRIQRGLYGSAIRIGILLDSLIDMLYLRELLVRLFPLFFELLLIQMEVSNLCTTLLSFGEVCREITNSTGEMWYYALCIYFHLQTGHMVEEMSTCIEYYTVQSERAIRMLETEGELRYLVAMWVWYLRTETYEQVDIWEARLPTTWTIAPNDSLNSMITTLMYIEGLILLVTFKIDRSVIFVVEQLYDKITMLLRKMEPHANKVKLIAPRFYHLKAYFYMTKMNDDDGWQFLLKALKAARYSDNSYDASWAEHSNRAWRRDMHEVEAQMWKDHATKDPLYFHELDIDNKLAFFTLKLPLNF